MDTYALTIRPNWLHYWFPGFVALCAIIGIESAPLGVFIIFMCVMHRKTNTVSVTRGRIEGKSGFKTFTCPLSKVQYCEYTGVGVFNKIRINALTGQFNLKNMTQAKEFVDLVNTYSCKDF